MITHQSTPQKEEIIPIFIDKLFKEYIFIMFQVAKILHKIGANSWHDFIEKKVVLNQTTSVRSYFIIKMLLLADIQKFINWINDAYFLIDHCIHGKNMFRTFINMSVSNFNSNKPAIKTLNDMIVLVDYYEKNKTNFHAHNVIFDTCRMSYHG